MKEQLYKAIQLLDDLQSTLNTSVLSFCRDKRNPINERWDMAKAAPSAFTVKGFYLDFKSLMGAEIDLYDDLYIDRYQKQDLLCDMFVERLVELAIPESTEGFSEEELFYHKPDTREFNVVNDLVVKEYILQLGFSSFVNDW
jgi:hypothetical protein